MAYDSVLGCPFCSRPLDAPEDVPMPFGATATGGRCDCGAVFVCDQTGHNLGDAYVDVMTLACDGDMDKAWSLTPDEDYTIMELTLDSRRNKFHEASGRRARKNVQTFIFVKIKEPGEKDPVSRS